MPIEGPSASSSESDTSQVQHNGPYQDKSHVHAAESRPHYSSEVPHSLDTLSKDWGHTFHLNQCRDALTRPKICFSSRLALDPVRVLQFCSLAGTLFWTLASSVLLPASQLVGSREISAYRGWSLSFSPKLSSHLNKFQKSGDRPAASATSRGSKHGNFDIIRCSSDSDGPTRCHPMVCTSSDRCRSRDGLSKTC